LIGTAWKVLRITAKVALVALAAVALLVGAAWSLLQTRRGGELVRRFAVTRVNQALAGEMTLGRFAFGGDRLTLENVAIHDPEARLVARVARIDVRFSPLALLRRHVDVERLEIRRPELFLVEDARGLNLTRALAPRHPAAAAGGGEAPSGSSRRRGTIDLRALVVRDGRIEYRTSTAKARGAGEAGEGFHADELSIDGRARFADDRLSAKVEVEVQGGRLDVNGAFDLADRRGNATLRASVRGLELDADARLDGEAIAARAGVVADDLAAASRGLGRDFGVGPIAIRGNGQLEVTAGGTTAAPSLRASARFPALSFGETRAQNLTASLWLPDAGVPEALDIEAGASALWLGERSLRAPSVTVHAAGRAVTAHVAIAAPQPLRIDLRGVRQQERAIAIDALSVRYPEATWTLRRRARLSFGPTLVLSGFELAANAQRLAVDLRLGGSRPSAHVAAAHVDLARLPPALIPPSVGLGGVVDADVRADLGDAPRIVAKAALANGRIRGHRNLSLELDAALERGRARGKLRARGLATAADASFDLPGEWPPRNPRAPLTLSADTRDSDLAAVAQAIADVSGGSPPRVKGRARVSVRLDGKVGQPRLRLLVAGRELAFDDHRIGDLELAVSGEGNGSTAARLTTIAPARSEIEITTPLSLRTILHHPPDADALARTRFDVKGTLDKLPLAMLGRAAGRGRVGGTLSAKLAVTGTVENPKGSVEIDVAGASADRFPPTDARIELGLDGAVDARARVVRKGRPLLALEARVESSVRGLLHRDRLIAAPVRLRAVLGPLAIQRVGLPAASEREPPRELKGRLHADVTVDGTLGAPRAVMHVQASDLRLDKSLVGFAEVEATYADRKAKVDARLTSQGGGTLRATVGVSADLGYPAVTRGLDLRRTPLDVRLDAQRFDVQGLSGVTPGLRTVAGLLTVSAAMRGTLADPRFSGRVEWKDGVVAITGFGEYKQIHLALHGDEDDVKLDELSVASGAGKARLTGHAKYAMAGSYELTAEAKLEKFPIYTQGQPLAVVAVEAKVRGRGALGDTRLNVQIDEAKVELPDAKRKDLQPLDIPPDIVLMDGDAPLNKEQAAKLKALLSPREARAGGEQRAARLRLRLNAPRHIWVSGKDAYLELGLSPDFRVSVGERTQIFGQVTVHRARVDVLGKRFDVKPDSTLTFGGAPDHPELDVRAEHKNDTEKITVLITIRGSPDDMKVSVTAPARPDLSESQLYTLIVTGRLQLGVGGTTNQSVPSQAASIVGGLLAGQLQSALASRLPLDVLTIDVGGGAQGMRGTKLEAGRYVTDRLYVGYIGRAGSDPTRYQNRNAVHLEYQISSRWEIDGEYGDLGTGTADLMWKKSY
jgi:translocation and assembly module TamB